MLLGSGFRCLGTLSSLIARAGASAQAAAQHSWVIGDLAQQLQDVSSCAPAPLPQQSRPFSSSSCSSNTCSGHERAATHWQQQVQQQHQQQVWLHPPLWQQQQQQHFQQQPCRHFSRRATRSIENTTLPPQIADLIAQSSVNNAVRPDAPPLEERPMQFESRRAGAIAVKAGMMQDWDEYGARVPLTVLWIDECAVSTLFTSWKQC
jgi:large subunit ribosomal protein L3